MEGGHIDVVAESVGRFSVNGIITNHAVFVRHAKWDAADVLDEAHDKGGDDLGNILARLLHAIESGVHTTFHPMMNMEPASCHPICFGLPAIAPPGEVRAKAAHPSAVAKIPTKKPPATPATKWVWKIS